MADSNIFESAFFMLRLSINKGWRSEGFSKKISIFVRFIIAFGVGSVSQKGLVKISNLQTYAHRYNFSNSRINSKQL